MGFREICGIGDRAGKWLRYKVFREFWKVGCGWDSMNLEWDFRGFYGI